MPDASTPTHSFTPPPQRRSLCLNDHDLSTSLPNSPMPRRRKTLALPNIPQQVRSQLLSHSPVTTPTYAIRPHTPSGITSQSFPIPPPIPTLSELAKMSPDYFPVQVELLNGFDSEVSQLQIFNQEKLRLNIHFVERTEVVKIIDAKGRMYFLPVNSPVKFGMLYESGMQASQQSTSHKTLKRVSDILSLSSLPKVISPQTNVVKKRDTYAEKGDVLIVKGTSKQSLKCYSLSKRTYLELEQACKGNFTTDAAMTKLYLSDIVNHVVDVFPCTAKIFLHEKIQSSVAEMQSGSDVTIYEKTIVSSLIATTVNRDSTACLMLPVNESVCTLSAHMVSTLSLEAAQQLLDTTQRLKTSFDLADFTLMRDTGDDDAFDLQNQLFKEVLSCSETDFDPYVIMFPASTGIPFASPTPTGDPFASPAYTGAPFASPKSLPTESSLFEPDENSLYVEITRSLKMGPAQLTSPQQESASEDNGAEMSTPHETQLPFKERNREFLGSMTTVQVRSFNNSILHLHYTHFCIRKQHSVQVKFKKKILIYSFNRC